MTDEPVCAGGGSGLRGVCLDDGARCRTFAARKPWLFHDVIDATFTAPRTVDEANRALVIITGV